MGVTDLFCSGCGKPIAEIKDAFAAQQRAEALSLHLPSVPCAPRAAPLLSRAMLSACRAAEAARRRLCRVMRHMGGTKIYDDFVRFFAL